VDEEVNRDKNGEADGMNLEVDSKDEVIGDAYLNERSALQLIIHANSYKNSIILQSVSMIFLVLHNSPSLENGLTKFHDFP